VHPGKNKEKHKVDFFYKYCEKLQISRKDTNVFIAEVL